MRFQSVSTHFADKNTSAHSNVAMIVTRRSAHLYANLQCAFISRAGRFDVVDCWDDYAPVVPQ